MSRNRISPPKHMSKPRPPGTRARSSNRSPRVLWIVLALLILLSLLGWKSWRVYTLAQALRQDVRALETVAAAPWDANTLETLEPLLAQTRQHATDLRDESRLFLYITPLFHALPEYGDDLAAVGPLLDMGANLTIALDESIPVLAPMASKVDLTRPVSTTTMLAEDLSAARPRLEQARTAIAEAAAARVRITDSNLQPSLQSQVQRATLLLSLLEAGIDLAIATDETATALLPMLSQDETMQLLDGSMAAQIGTARLQIGRAQAALEQAAASWEQVPLAQLPTPLQNRVKPVATLLQLTQDGLELALLLPDLLGASGSRTYLILVQNPDELRATGGFITAAGTMTFANGALKDWTIGDSTLMDNFAAGAYPLPPEPLRHYMNLGLWVLRDSNWSPDFPTAAAAAEELYTIAHDEDIDGVIAMTPTLFQYMLTVLGPMEIEGTAEPLTADTVLAYVRDAWAPAQAINDSWHERKTLYMQRLTQAIIHHLETEIDRTVLPDLVTYTLRALNERHLMLVLDDDDAAQLLARHGWDGAVRPGEGDFLMVVDSNVGYNKANASIEQQVFYTVSLSELERPSAIVTVQHTNLVQESLPCKIEVVFLEGDYADMTRACYWDYLRILVPEGSQYFAANTHPTPAEWMFSEAADDGAVEVSEGPASTAQLATFVVVPTAEERQTSMYYRLPASVVMQDEQGWRYQLKVQKQPGREPVPVQVTVRLPNHATLVSTSHTIASQQEQILVFDLLLAQDQTLDVVFATTE